MVAGPTLDAPAFLDTEMTGTSMPAAQLWSHENSSPTAVIVTLSAASEIEERLTYAVEQLRSSKEARKQGILVTRKRPGSFVIDFSAEVPPGFIFERDAT